MHGPDWRPGEITPAAGQARVYGPIVATTPIWSSEGRRAPRLRRGLTARPALDAAIYRPVTAKGRSTTGLRGTGKTVEMALPATGR